jgi:hypothetical protein
MSERDRLQQKEVRLHVPECVCVCTFSSELARTIYTYTVYTAVFGRKFIEYTAFFSGSGQSQLYTSLPEAWRSLGIEAQCNHTFNEQNK